MIRIHGFQKAYVTLMGYGPETAFFQLATTARFARLRGSLRLHGSTIPSKMIFLLS